MRRSALGLWTLLVATAFGCGADLAYVPDAQGTNQILLEVYYTPPVDSGRNASMARIMTLEGHPATLRSGVSVALPPDDAGEVEYGEEYSEVGIAPWMGDGGEIYLFGELVCDGVLVEQIDVAVPSGGSIELTTLSGVGIEIRPLLVGPNALRLAE